MMKTARKPPIRSYPDGSRDFSGIIGEFLDFKSVTLRYREELDRKRRVTWHYTAVAFVLGLLLGMLIFH